jgi:serine protease Do
MRRWQTWFFSRSGQLLFWVAIIVAGWFVVGRGAIETRSWLPSASPRVVLTQSSAPAPAPGSLTAVARATMPAVVNIASARTVRGPEAPGPYAADPFFRFFFGPEMAPRREKSLGSGVIVTSDGYVLTNNHVIEGAQDIRVTLSDRREFTASLVGADPKTDLAVLRLTGSGLAVMPLADSSRVDVADIVLAIGNPFGLSQTVTMGIVSAVGRASLGIADYEDFIQTDAAINPGNSGGALVNASGALIGVNTAIFSQSGGYAGIGFAVPSNMARQVMDQLVTRGKVTRGYLGASVQELTPAVARGLGLSVSRGILVGDVMPDGPAARAGLRRGDVVTAIDDKPVDDAGQFRNTIAATAPGTRRRLTVLRDGKEQAVEVAVGELPAERTARAAPARGPDAPLGVSVADLTPELARRLGQPVKEGAVITEVDPRGLAAEAGLRPGDVIQEVNRQPVRTARDFARAVEQARGRDTAVLVNRGGSTAYVAIARAG